MAKRGFTPKQIVAILRKVERAASQSEVLRRRGISDQTYYHWRKKYGGLGTSQVRQIKELEKENRKRRQVVWELTSVVSNR